MTEMKKYSSNHLDTATWRGRFCLANWLAVGFIRVEVLGKTGLIADFDLAFSSSVDL